MADINIDVYYTGFLFARDERIPSRGRHLSRRCDITKKIRYRGAIATSFVESVYMEKPTILTLACLSLCGVNFEPF